MTIRALIYARISRDEQDKREGVTRQLEDCRALAEQLGWEVVGEHVDNDVSAYSGKPRPEYRALLRRLESGDIDGVLAFHTDRIHRSPRELEHYIDVSEAHGITTHTVKAGPVDLSTPSGRAVARTLGAWARYESEHNSERVRRALLQRAQQGKRHGGPVPFGYRVEDGKPVPVPEQAEAVRDAYRAIVAGRSIGSIVRDLNDKGITTGRGGAWTSTSVRNLILRPSYAGFVKHQGSVLEGAVSEYPALVSEDVWRAAVGIVGDPSRRASREDAVRHLLSGLAACGACGGPLRITARSKSQRGESGQRFYYKCVQLGGGHAHQKAEPLEEYVGAVVVAYMERPEVAEALAVQDAPGVDVEALRAEERALGERLAGAADMFADGSITGPQLQKITATTRGKLDAVRAELSRATEANPIAGFAGPGAGDRWAATDTEGRRAIIDAVVTVIVDPVGKARPRMFDPDRVRFEWKA